MGLLHTESVQTKMGRRLAERGTRSLPGSLYTPTSHPWELQLQDLHSFSHWQPWAGSLPTLRSAASVPGDAAGTPNGEAGGPGLPSQLCPWPAG